VLSHPFGKLRAGSCRKLRGKDGPPSVGGDADLIFTTEDTRKRGIFSSHSPNSLLLQGFLLVVVSLTH
jgi:hypothetical protein